MEADFFVALDQLTKNHILFLYCFYVAIIEYDLYEN